MDPFQTLEDIPISSRKKKMFHKTSHAVGLAAAWSTQAYLRVKDVIAQRPREPIHYSDPLAVYMFFQ